jgi:hypothetical protein
MKHSFVLFTHQLICRQKKCTCIGKDDIKDRRYYNIFRLLCYTDITDSGMYRYLDDPDPQIVKTYNKKRKQCILHLVSVVVRLKGSVNGQAQVISLQINYLNM